MTSLSRPRRLAALCAVVTVLLGGTAIPAWSAPTPPETAPPTEPTTTVAPATSTAPPTADSPDTTTTTVTTPSTGPASSSTTTLPGDTTTITTLAPDATIPAAPNAPTWIQPVIPDAESDPVFHAAREVDAATVEVDKSEKAVVEAQKSELVARRRRARADEIKADATDHARGADRAVDRAQGEVRNAAIRSYMGFGGDLGAFDEAAVVEATNPKAVSRTYLSVTADEARGRLAVSTAQQKSTHRALDIAEADASNAHGARDGASRTLGQARQRLVEANRKLADARKKLLDAVASAPDFGPGSLKLLPSKIEDGATTVPSPAGLIVLPKGTDSRVGYALAFVVAQLGKPYVWGATGPGTYDCSGLMLRAFAAVGVTLPRVSQAQQASVTPVDAADLRPGDLVFFGRPAYHVGMYIGGGLMINAPYTGSVVRVDRIWPTVTSYGRVLPLTSEAH